MGLWVLLILWNRWKLQVLVLCVMTLENVKRVIRVTCIIGDIIEMTIWAWLESTELSASRVIIAARIVSVSSFVSTISDMTIMSVNSGMGDVSVKYFCNVMDRGYECYE